jgi:Right handed beta helix region
LGEDIVRKSIRLASVAALVAGSLALPAQAALATTTTVGSGRYENTSASIAYAGSWQVNTHSSDSGGNSSNGKIAGDSAQLTFNSTGVQWLARTGPALGLGKVYLDGAHVATVDLYSAVQQFQRPVYSNKSLASGTHTIKVVRVGAKNALSRGNDIVVDAIVVSDTAAPAAPAGVTATEERKGIRISWSAGTAADLAGYRVYRATATGEFEPVSGNALLTGTSFLDVGLLPGKGYRFVVVAQDSSGNVSDRSAVRSVTPAVLAPVQRRYSDCPTTGTVVSNITQLRAAVSAAKPGSVIRLASGVYRGGVSVARSGTSTAPIWICGPRTAVLDNSNVASANGFFVNNVSNVVISGMTIQNFRKGVVLSTASRITVSDVLIRNIGEEAVKVRYGTTDSTIVKNTIQNTGRVNAQYGEGVYIGSSPKDWCAVYNCNTDRSDRNSVIANTISGTTADPIEAKPGTAGGVIRNNTVDGARVVAADTLIAVKGNDYLVLDNVGTSQLDTRGLYAMETEVPGYGYGNVFARNTVSVPVGATAVFVGPENLVDCNNAAPVVGSVLTNRDCQK